MSCLHIQGVRREVSGCTPFKFLGRERTTQREAGVRANAVHANPAIRAAAASSYAAPVDVLLRLTYDQDEGVRTWVARNETAPADALRILAGDPSARVRAYVAWNPHTPLALIKLLVEDSDLVVRELAEQRLLADQAA